MEIKGEDFIKKVQLTQEKNEIEQRLNELKNQESRLQDRGQTPPKSPRPDLDREIEIQEEQEYSDIMLNNSTSNEVNKKKYLVLGLALVILFLLTIIVIRLLTNDSSEDESFSNNANKTQKVIESENIEEQYQKIINEKLKNIKEENEKVSTTEQKVEENLDLQKIEEKEKIVEKVQESKPDVFNVKEEEPAAVVKVVKEEPKPVIKKVEPKPVVVKNSVPVKTNEPITSKPNGTFVQIGAFSKMPTQNYLNGISSKGFSYKIYKVSINNKLFHKVLIGPYNSRGQAKLAIDDIKKKLNINGAFILTF